MDETLAYHVFFALQPYVFRGVAKFGIALGSGPRGLEFESRHSDHWKPAIYKG